MDVRTLWRKGDKLGRLLADEQYRRALIRTRVAATVEHRAVMFRSAYQTVLDVGANRGQFALFAQRRFPDASLWCFEPGPAAFRRLQRVVGTSARCLPVALGAAPGNAELQLAHADDSSSLLAPTELQTVTYADTAIAGTVGIEVRTLDGFAAEIESPFLLKVDVQGYELEVLRGGRCVLEGDGDLLLECSFRELYAGQPLADEIIAFVLSAGYHLRGVYSVTHGPDGTPLQGDFFFAR